MNIWITWESQRRNRTSSAELGFKLYEITYTGNRVVRYIVSIYKTLLIINKNKPDILVVQNPSLVLALLTVSLKKIFGYIIVVDSHNAGVRPFEGKKYWANMLAKTVIENTDLTIVTNEMLGMYIQEVGGKAVILPDPFPAISCPQTSNITKSNDYYNIVCISSWAEDEPYIEVLKAAAQLPVNARLFISGNSKGKEKVFNDIIPSNVKLTGYLSEQDYINLLCNSNLCIVLTTRNDCMVCGAYEAIAAGKSLLLSNTPVLKSYFGNYAQFTDNDGKSIAQSIIAIMNARADVNEHIVSRMAIQNKWEAMKLQLQITLTRMIKERSKISD